MLCPIDFWLLFTLSFASRDFLWFLQCSMGCLVTYCLASKCLCFLHFFVVVVDFKAHSTVARKNASYDFTFLKFAEAWFVAQNVICSRKCSKYAWGIFILMLWDEIFYKYLLSPSALMHHLRSVFPCWFSVRMICPLL